MPKWSTLTPDDSLVDSTTEIVVLQDDNSNQRMKFSIPTLGKTVIPVHKISDIPLVNGFRQLPQDSVIQFVEAISSPEMLLIPAGWNGYIIGAHNPLTDFTFTGPGASSIKTLNLNGTITSITDAGGGAITVTTSAPHLLSNGQFVNITGTTSYNQQKLLLSNATGLVFDVQIPFVGDSLGAFDTGYDAVNIMNMAFSNFGGGGWLDVTATTISSIFRYYNLKVSTPELGNIRKGRIIGYDGNMTYNAGDGLILTDIDKATISTTTITETGMSPTCILLEINGSLTRDIVLDKMQFNVGDPGAFPVRIDGGIMNADRISITNSPDNGIATDYFANGAGALDQTDPQVFTFNNGTRPNSTTALDSRSVGVLEVDGSGGVAVPVVDITPVSGDFVLDSVSERFSLNTLTGVVTYNGLSPRTVIIAYSLDAAQTSAASQDLILDLRINNVQQAKTIKTMTTIGVGSFVSVVSLGGLFAINPNDTFQLFKDNTSNTNNTDIQNVVLLIR